MSKTIIGAALAAAILATPLSLSATENAQAKPTVAAEKPAKAKQMPFRGKIKAVDKKAKTVTLLGRTKDRVFRVSETSKIRREGKTVKLETLRKGESVGGLARMNGEGQWVVVTLNIKTKVEQKKEPSEEPKK
jgi:hypothetical protein